MELQSTSPNNKTPKEMVEAKLADKEEVFRLLVDAVEDYAIFALDPDGFILTWNLGGERLKGYKAHEVVGSHFSRFYTKADIDRGHPAFELKEAEEKGKYEEEGWRIRKDGKMFWANVVITALRDKSGELKGFGKVTRDLTARKQAEIALKESEERFRLMVTNVSDYAIIMLDPAGNISSWNAGAEKIKGYRSEDIIGKHFSTFYPTSDIEAGKPEMELRIAGDEGRYEEEGWRVRRDGTMYWANVTITALRSNSDFGTLMEFNQQSQPSLNPLRGFAKVTRDLTSRRQSEEALRQSQERYRLLVDSIKDYALILLDPRGRVTSWNAGATSILGYESKEILGTHVSKFYVPADAANGKPGLELKAAADVGRYENEALRYRKDGTTFFASVVLTAIRDEFGNIRGYSNVTRDLTQQRIAEQKLRESEERFRLMIESVHDYSIFMLDPNGVIVTWNKGAERNKGYTAAEIIGQHFSTFYSEEDKQAGKPKAELEEARLTGKFEEEGWRFKKDGSAFWASVIITPIFDERRALLGFAKVTRNLTERKKAEDDLRAAYADLEKRIEERTKELFEAKINAEKAVVARDQFFSIASHELKTPLTSLKLQTQIRKRCIAKGDLSDFTPENIPALCDDDERQILRLAFLVDNMLDISKLTSGSFKLTPEPVDLGVLVQDVLKRLDVVLKEAGGHCSVEMYGKVIGRWDRHRIEQVVTNLLTNAVKYARGSAINVSLSSDESIATIVFRDYGPGISAEAQEKVFLPFQRLDRRSADGLGLGLYIIKQIIEAHGGSIEIEKDVPGASFLIELPLNPPFTHS